MAKLNDLTGKEWVKSTKSWFTLQSRQRYKTIKHPGKFPEELAEKFILFFSKKNEVVFDPLWEWALQLSRQKKITENLKVLN